MHQPWELPLARPISVTPEQALLTQGWRRYPQRYPQRYPSGRTIVWKWLAYTPSTCVPAGEA
ncbi:MAG: hypothetical protein ACLQUY_22145 [Ktedonobacterales bacterium]